MSEHPENKGKTGVVATAVAAIIGAGAIGSCMSKGAKTAKVGRTLERIEDGQSYTTTLKNSENPEEQNGPSLLDIMGRADDAQTTADGIDNFSDDENRDRE